MFVVCLWISQKPLIQLSQSVVGKIKAYGFSNKPLALM